MLILPILIIVPLFATALFIVPELLDALAKTARVLAFVLAVPFVILLSFVKPYNGEHY